MSYCKKCVRLRKIIQDNKKENAYFLGIIILLLVTIAVMGFYR